jgi:hypothetical protein
LAIMTAPITDHDPLISKRPERRWRERRQRHVASFTHGPLHRCWGPAYQDRPIEGIY